MSKTVWVLLLFVAAGTLAQAEKRPKLVEVEGTATYVYPEYISRAAAQEEVLRRAQENALEQAFGYDVGGTNYTYIDNSGSHFVFTSLSQLRGVWVETLGKPQFTRSFHGDQDVISCTVRGKVRERSASQAWPEWQLQNAQGVETSQFKNGEYYHISFQSSTNGYLAIYLIDEDGQANRLLPYAQQEESCYQIKRGVQYRFFDSSVGDVPGGHGTVDNMVQDCCFTCAVPFVVNDLYIIFSPNRFAVPVDELGHTNRNKERLPPQLPQKKFLSWLSKVQAADEEMCVDNRRAAIQSED